MKLLFFNIPGNESQIIEITPPGGILGRVHESIIPEIAIPHIDDGSNKTTAWSRKHARFDFLPDNNTWYITILSAQPTKLNNSLLQRDVPTRLDLDNSLECANWSIKILCQNESTRFALRTSGQSPYALGKIPPPDFKLERNERDVVRLIQPRIIQIESESLSKTADFGGRPSGRTRGDPRVGDCRFEICLNCELETLIGSNLVGLLGLVRQAANNAYLRLHRITLGSVVLIIDGEKKAFSILKLLHENGMLTQLLGISVTDVRLSDSSPLPPNSATSGPVGQALCAFYIFAEKDEQYREQLELHLTLLRKQQRIIDWDYSRIIPGTDRAAWVDEYLNKADLILLLVSAHFFACEDCFEKDLAKAMHRYEEGSSRVLPILLRPVYWKGAPFAHLQVLPKNLKPIATWVNQDEAWVAVVEGICEILDEHHSPSK